MRRPFFVRAAQCAGEGAVEMKQGRGSYPKAVRLDEIGEVGLHGVGDDVAVRGGVAVPLELEEAEVLQVCHVVAHGALSQQPRATAQ